MQSTPAGLARAFNLQDGLFTLAEQGIEQGKPVRRTRLIGSVSRALHADDEWERACEVASRPELRLIVSNVTEAGFRPEGYARKLTDLLRMRFARLPEGPSLFVIPTELVPDNGPRLASMVDQLAQETPDVAAFRAWIAANVRFCSSLVDRITTGAPDATAREAMEARLGYHDSLLTVTEPYWLWAIEGDPEALREVLPIDDASAGAVLFAPDISFYRERKLRLLNGAHTALAPLAMMAGVGTVRETAEHPRLGPFLERLLFDEIVPGSTLTPEAGASFAREVIDRFRNPWLEHRWEVIVQNQTAKLRHRVVPSVADFVRKRKAIPAGLALALAASLRFLRVTTPLGPGKGRGWWRGQSYHIVDVDLDLINRHWRGADPALAAGAIPAAALERLATSALADAEIWEQDLGALPGLRDAVTEWLVKIEGDGIIAALVMTQTPNVSST